MSNTGSPPHPLFVTGLSGAGMSSALKVLEDLGYEVFDNFPLTLVEQLVADSDGAPVAIGIDSRSRGFSASALIDTISKVSGELLYLTADTDTLQTRFSETRRTHPQAKDRTVADGIGYERHLFEPLNEHIKRRIDTTRLSPHDLRALLEDAYRLRQKSAMSVTIMSFGFKKGPPREADMILDVRFLRNPHWEPELKPFTGQHPKIAGYIAEDPLYDAFLAQSKALLETVLNGFKTEGKQYLTLAIGCTGGKHRSVHIAETLNDWMAQNWPDISLGLRHRDIPLGA